MKKDDHPVLDFEKIYQLYSAKIFRVCMGYTNDEELARDLLQETFISVWTGLKNFRGESQISTWIYRIATNKCLRAKEVDGRMPRAEWPADLAQEEGSSPEEKLSILMSCIAKLKEHDRLIISLELEGLPQAEIASVVGLGEGNVRVRIHRIKDKLKQMLLKYEPFR